jgi:hypothetical protein
MRGRVDERRRLEQEPELPRVEDVLVCEGHHNVAAPRLGDDEAFGLEVGDGLTNGGLANAELRGEADLGDG